MTYKLTLSDNSFFIVDENYKLVLFHKENYTNKVVISVQHYLNSDYFNFVLLDKVDETLIPLTFTIEEFDNKNNIPLYKRLKRIQDVRQGDKVLGPDNLPRTVMDLHRGEDEMFEIKTEEGITHRVNGDHMLHLVNKFDTKDTVDISVKGYLAMDDSFKEAYKLVKIIQEV